MPYKDKWRKRLYQKHYMRKKRLMEKLGLKPGPKVDADGNVLYE